MNDCNQYWHHADYLPIDTVISYWCELSGFDTTHCRDAKKAAICSAVAKNLIKFRRSDGKTFEDDVFNLASRGVLQIEKDSFNVWAEQFADAPVIEKPLSNRERDTLLTIIAALAKHGKIEIKECGKSAQFISGLTDEVGANVSKRAIEEHLKKIPAALEVRMK